MEKTKAVWRRAAMLAVCVAGVAVAASAQTTTKSTETKHFTVVSVDGNKVVARLPEGTREITVPDDFRFTVDGKEISVRELHPGMKGTAHITTTTTVTPVTVTEVKNGEVMQASGNSVLVRTAEGFKNFTEGDISKRGVTIIKDGQPVRLSDLHTGDRLSATIVTEHPPKVLTQRQVQATITGAAPAATSGSAPAASRSTSSAATPAAAAGEPAAAPKKLPKTASPLPLVGVLGALSLAMGLSLSIARKRRS